MLILCAATLAISVSVTSAEIKQSDNILLRDGELVITKEDMIRYIESVVPPSERAGVLRNQDRMLTLLQNLFVTRALAARAGEFGVTLDADQLAWEQDFKRDTDLAIAIQQEAVKRSQSNVNWEALARELYIAEGERYMTEPQVDAAHILISTQSRKDSEALKLAESVKEKVLATDDFHALAREYSDDKTAASNGGELGTFKRGAMVKPFSDAVFDMTRPGEISGPVKTQFGYHIIKLNKIVASHKQSFDEVKAQAIKTVKARMEGQVRDTLLSETRSKPNIYVNKELFKEIKDEYVSQNKK